MIHFRYSESRPPLNRLLSRLALPALIFFTILFPAHSQTTPTSCPAPPAILSSTQPNIFSEQQEQWLGDAMADMIESDYKPVQDPAQNEYLARIAKRLLAALPPTTIQFRVLLVDSPDVNGFSLAGGRVYLTRKLVANAKNEDEVAAVIGHEMGHILSHQFAIETTADLKRLLNITSVGDKADIYAKFQQLVDARIKDKHPSPGGDSDEKQNEADTVSVYATAAAGYRPQAYAEFWDRMFFVDGKVGGKLSDFFGATKPEAKRLRAILRLINALPPGCGATKVSDSVEFEHWHALVVANQSVAVEASAKPITEVTLTPPLRMDIDRLRFSRDGKYILAQDESSIFVLSREPYTQVFRFDAEKALPAEFSPDSQHIVFHTPGLHTEEWSVPEQKLITSHEPVARQDCLQTKFSPDGRTLFCFSIREQDEDLVLDLTMLDAASGETLYQKKGFFLLSEDALYTLAIARRFSIPVDLIPSSFSADGNVVLMGNDSDKVAFDLRTRQPIPLGGGLKGGINGSYAFVGSEKVFGVNTETNHGSGYFSFPDGKQLQTVPFDASDLESVTSGNYVLSYKVNDYPVGLADLSAAKFIVASRAPSMDVFDGFLLNENADGSIVLHKIGDKTVPDQTAILPISPLGPSLRAITSPDGHYLALSTHTRGGVWDLTTGQRVLLSSHFNSGVFAADNTFYAEFPKMGKQDRAITHFDWAPFSAAPVSYKEDDNMRLTGGMLQEWKPTSKKAVELIVHDVLDNSILWRRTFDDGEPAHTFNFVSGQTIFAFRLKSDFAKGRIKANPALATQAAAVKNRDATGIIQLIDDTNGNILHELVLEVPFNYDGLDGINIVGDSLYLTSADNRTMVYAVATGTQTRQLFGYVVAVDSASGRICTINRRDEAVIYDAQGQQLADFHMGTAIRFAIFQPTGQHPGSGLMLLTADQKVRTMEIPTVAHSQSVSP